jgi:DNA-binding MltR family transcriptional regulator
MGKHRNLDESKLDEKEKIFKQTVDIINENITELSKRKSIAVLESVMFGIASNLSKIKSMKREEISSLLNKLLHHSSLSPEVLKEDLASKDKVLARLNAARKVFSGL